MDDTTTSLCDLNGGGCPSQQMSAVVNADRTALSFVVPEGMTSGIYSVAVHDDPRQPSTGVWFGVDASITTRPIVTPEEHTNATMILPGQTVNGTLTGDNPSGTVSDYNFYYFVGTAGSTINVSLDRVDTSQSWEHPDSLDPQLEVIAPDGFVYQNLTSFDNQPGVDLNASLHEAVLPMSGLYFISVETTRGHGDYRLSFSYGTHTPAADVDRDVPIAGNDQTLPIGTLFSTATLILDPQGNPMSGAWVEFDGVPAPEDHATLVYSPVTDPARTKLTTVDGFALKWLQIMSTGKAQFEPRLLGTYASSLSTEPVTVTALATQTPIPRYQAVGRAALSVREVTADGTARLAFSGVSRLPIERQHPPREVRDVVRHGGLTARATGSPGSAASTLGAGNTGLDRMHEDDLGPADASTAVPLPEVTVDGMAATAQAISSCEAGRYAVAGTTPNWASPYVMTLSDETPPTGQTSGAHGYVGVAGIFGHRIEHTVRLKLEIGKQGVGPVTGVLVHVAVGGVRHGTIILDPDHARIECSDATFLFGDSDSTHQGTLNQEFEYRIGTLATFVGVEADPNNPGHVKPVWGAAESLTITLETADGPTTTFFVHPEPGQPDHLVSPDTFTYWNSYSTSTDVSGYKLAGAMTTFDAAHLQDAFNNTVYGFTNTSATQPASNVAVQFTDQTSGAYDDFSAYTIQNSWQADGTGQMPVGTFPSTLSVTYPNDFASEWTGGTVSKQIDVVLQGGTFHALTQVQRYDESIGTPGVDDLPFPLTVSPGADQGAMPKTVAGDTPRLVLLALAGSEVPTSILQGTDQPSLDPNHVYRLTSGAWPYTQVDDAYPTLEVNDTSSQFRLAIVDGNGNTVPDTKFTVHTCPRDEHLTQDSPPAACSDAKVPSGEDSSGVGTGVLETFTLNGPRSQRGYMGIELTQAPVNPGTYFLVVQSLGPTIYRIRQESQMGSYYGSDATNDAIGGFAICTVMGAEILDGNFQRINPEIIVDQPTPIYVRYLMGEAAGNAATMTVTLDTRWPDGTIYSPAQNLQLSQIGSSGVYLGEASLTPSDGQAASAQDIDRIAETPSSSPSLPVPGGPGTVNTRLPGNPGNPGSTANTARDLNLTIQFLDANGQNVVAQPVVGLQKVADPNSQGHFIYVEECKARVAATMPDSGAVDTTAKGYVGVREQANTGLLSNDRYGTTLQFSYNETLGKAATVLAQYKNPQPSDYGKDYQIFQLAGGVGPLMTLDSIAQPRRDQHGDPPLNNTWASILVAVPSLSGRTQGLHESDPQVGRVPQWVDNATYSAAGAIPCQQGPSAPCNGLPDWLEATAWDAVNALRSGNSDIDQYVGNSVVDIIAGSGPLHAWAFVSGGATGASNLPEKIQLDASQIPVGPEGTAIRRDGQWAGPDAYHGLQWSEPHRLTCGAKHEARHCWQHTLPDNEQNSAHPSYPGDGIPDSMGQTPDPMALALLDSPFFKRPQGQGTNTEFDFYGPSTVDDRSLVSDALERDAARWEARVAGTTVASNIKCLASNSGNLVVVAGGGPPIFDYGDPVPTGVPVTIALGAVGILNEAHWGSGTSVFVPGVTVQLSRETDPLPGDSTPGNSAALILDPHQPDGSGNPGQVITTFGTTNGASPLNGQVQFTVIPASGLNIFSAIAWDLTPAGDGSGAQVNECQFSQPQKIYFTMRGTP